MTNKTEWEGHTPLPWQNGIEDREGIVSVAPVSHVGDGNVICEPPDWRMVASYKRWDANAALIVHCVNNFPALEAERDALREALNALVEEYACNVDCTRIAGFYTDPETEDCIINARQALAISEKSE